MPDYNNYNNIIIIILFSLECLDVRSVRLSSRPRRNIITYNKLVD